MAAAKVAAFLRDDTHRVQAIVGPSGCGKKHVIAEAARQAGIGVAHHDLAQGPVNFGRLGGCQLSTSGLSRGVHVLCNASEELLKDYSWAKATFAKIILVADDAGPSMRASGVPVVRMQALSADAMAKRLFHEEGWPADAAVRAAKVARGDWHQLHAHAQLCSGPAGDALPECSGKDATLANAPPCFVANQLLNGTVDPESCPLDAGVVAWTERNMGMHCADIEAMAQKQEALAAATAGYLESNPVGEALFVSAARYQSQHVQYRPGLYATPWKKDETAVQAIRESYQRQRARHSTRLKEEALQEERACSAACAPLRKPRAKPRAKPRGKPKARAPTRRR